MAGPSGFQIKQDGTIALCASCDRCRSRKTKCDGQRPCGNCAKLYMKKHKLTSIEGIDPTEFDCVYSPAKRRGPVPGKSGQTRKATEAFYKSTPAATNNNNNNNNNGIFAVSNTNGFANPASSSNNGNGIAMEVDWQQQQQQQQQQCQPTQQPALATSADVAQQMQQILGSNPMNLFQQLQQHQAGNNNNNNNNDGMMQSQPHYDLSNGSEQPRAQRVRREINTDNNSNSNNNNGQMMMGGIPKTVSSHTHLLERSDVDGNRLRAYYRLSIDELFRLPLPPTDEEYCAKWNASNPGAGKAMTPSSIPGPHLAALSASRFAEVALGAVVHQETSLAMELCNAVVHCLRESVAEPVQDSYLYEVTRSYFLLGVFRACRGDMERYFKYRRVAMTYAAKLPDGMETQTLMAAISYLDAWAYMIYNADEERLPVADGGMPRVEGCGGGQCSRIASDPQNQNWIQGAPPVYLNNEAPLPARALDALSCAVRTCCDQANNRFEAISRAAELGEETVSEDPHAIAKTPTATAVLANENELCSRNMVLSAFTLMQQYEASTDAAVHRSQGQRMVISAMDAFLDNSGDEGGGFTDSQIQSLLSVCNTAIENPFLLHHAGPSYHMVSNAAILLCHLLNGMHALKNTKGKLGDMELAMFEEALDTLIAVRKVLTIHRRKLPVKLRCHGIPKPSLAVLVNGLDSSPQQHEEYPNINQGKPLIDLGETVLCACRGCQGFVLMACSPCVAAERAMAAQERLEVENTQELDAVEQGDLDRELDDLGAEFNLDDDALLGMISQLITN